VSRWSVTRKGRGGNDFKESRSGAFPRRLFLRGIGNHRARLFSMVLNYLICQFLFVYLFETSVCQLEI
jgi:hypothetical protein